MVHLPAARLLRRHEGHRALDQTFTGRGLKRRLVLARLAEEGTLFDIEELRQAEVDELGMAFLGEHHVPRLDVAVHDAALVGVGEPRGDADPNPDGFGKRQGSLGEAARETRTPHQLHGDEDDAVGFVDLVDDADMRMLERGRGLGLRDETLPPLGLLDQLRREDLEGHLAVQLVVSGPVDDLDFAPVELLEEGVVREFSSDPALSRVELVHLLINHSSRKHRVRQFSLRRLNLQCFAGWCRRRESNPHSREDRGILSPVRLPVPPLRPRSRDGGKSSRVRVHFLSSRESSV